VRVVALRRPVLSDDHASPSLRDAEAHPQVGHGVRSALRISPGQSAGASRRPAPGRQRFLLEVRVLFLRLLQPLGVVALQPAVLVAPAAQAPLADLQRFGVLGRGLTFAQQGVGVP